MSNNKNFNKLFIVPAVIFSIGLFLFLFAAYCNENDLTNWPTVQLTYIISGAIALVGIVLAFILWVKKTTMSTSSDNRSATSGAEELKKFKDLLDAGVISQEEFDAKKKQLLGL